MIRNLIASILAGAALVLTHAAFGQGKDAFLKPRLLPGEGVADPATKVGYFPSAKGGIDAVDLANGKLLWTSQDAAKPLLATDTRLFAQRTEKGKGNQVRIVILDGQDQGKRLFESEPVVFTDWVAVETVYGRTFRSSVRVDAGSLWLTWEARAFYAGGARPSPEIEKAARKEASGVAQVSFDTRKVTALDADKIAAGKFFPMSGDMLLQKAGALMLRVNDEPAKVKGNPFARRRTIQALNEAKEIVWQHEIAAPVFLPPPP